MEKRFSRFVHLLEKNDIVALYNATNHNTAFIKKREFEKVQKALNVQTELPDSLNEAILSLQKEEFIVASISYDDQKLADLQSSILSTPWINTLYLLITDDCNFGCKYCFFKGSYNKTNSSNIYMSESTAVEAVHNFAIYLQEAERYSGSPALRPNIIFYGGEPFMNVEVLKKTVREVELLKIKGRLSDETMMNVNSNGALITEKIAEFCASHQIEVDVSLDGYRSIHDTNRIWRDKKSGTFQAVIRAIDRLKKAGANVCISCTVAETNVEELPEIFNWFIDELGITSIGFNPLLDSHQYQVRDSAYYRKIAQAMIECYKIARWRGAYEDRIMRKVRAFVEGTLYDRDCCGCGQQVVVAPNGSVGVCHAYAGTKQYFVPQGQKVNPYKHPFWNEWSRRSPINMSNCHKCMALIICGGGCPHNAHVQRGSIWEVDEGFCVHAKETLEWLIWDLYEQGE